VVMLFVVVMLLTNFGGYLDMTAIAVAAAPQ